MAYKKEELYQKSLAAIKKHKLLFIEDVAAYVACNKTTLYKHFPPDSNEMNDLKDAMESNKVAIKVKLRKKWQSSDNSTVQIALYRLVCDNEERRLLATNYTEVTGKDGKDLFGQLSDDDLNKRIAELENKLKKCRAKSK